MNKQLMFNLKTDITNIPIPTELNNPFGINIPEVAKVAANEFQEYITKEAKIWDYDFAIQKGKMFGVLVIQQEDNSLGYLGAVSGALETKIISNKMVPTLFNENSNDPFISNGLTDIKKIGLQIKASNQENKIVKLKKERKARSNALQKRLFEETLFLNIQGVTKNVLEIFAMGSFGYPPAAAGECAAPKLLQYALSNNLKPIAIVEFWWGNSTKSKERIHKGSYPACKDKCRPILEYVLGNDNLFQAASTSK